MAGSRCETTAMGLAAGGHSLRPRAYLLERRTRGDLPRRRRAPRRRRGVNRSLRSSMRRGSLQHRHKQVACVTKACQARTTLDGHSISIADRLRASAASSPTARQQPGSPRYIMPPCLDFRTAAGRVTSTASRRLEMRVRCGAPKIAPGERTGPGATLCNPGRSGQVGPRRAQGSSARAGPAGDDV